MGLEVGAVGDDVGNVVGDGVGDGVGSEVGAVGDAVGSEVGVVGDAVGSGLGGGVSAYTKRNGADGVTKLRWGFIECSKCRFKK